MESINLEHIQAVLEVCVVQQCSRIEITLSQLDDEQSIKAARKRIRRLGTIATFILILGTY